MGDTIFPGLGDIADALGGEEVQQSTAGQLLEEIARQFFNQTNPVRNSLLDRSSNFLNGNLDVTQSPMYGSIKAANEAQFKRARDNVIANTASGGALTSALTNLEGQRAANMATQVGNLANDEMSRAYGFANPQAAMAGLGSAGAIQAQIANAQAQQTAGAKQGMGRGAGMILGGK